MTCLDFALCDICLLEANDYPQRATRFYRLSFRRSIVTQVLQAASPLKPPRASLSRIIHWTDYIKRCGAHPYTPAGGPPLLDEFISISEDVYLVETVLSL